RSDLEVRERVARIGPDRPAGAGEHRAKGFTKRTRERRLLRGNRYEVRTKQETENRLLELRTARMHDRVHALPFERVLRFTEVARDEVPHRRPRCPPEDTGGVRPGLVVVTVDHLPAVGTPELKQPLGHALELRQVEGRRLVHL